MKPATSKPQETKPIPVTPNEARMNLVKFGRQHAGVHRALNVHQRWVK